MIKSLAYFPSQCARNSNDVVQALLSCVKTQGISVQENSMDAEAAVIWSVLWHGRMAPNQQVWQHYRSTGRPVIVVDVGALYRGETWKIALDCITAKGYYGHQQNLDWDRPRKLGISLAINVSRNPRIVIALQHAHSQQVAGIASMEDWTLQQVQRLRQVTQRPIVIRPHPRSPLNLSSISDLHSDVYIEQPARIVNTYDSYNLTFDCHAMVNHNSGPGIQAALAGTRPIVDSSSLAHAVSIAVDSIEKPYDIDRDTWLVEICHTEYTLEEIRLGTWLKRILHRL